MTTLKHEICEDRPEHLRDDTIYLITGARKTRDHDIFYAAIPCQCDPKAENYDTHFNVYTYGKEPDQHGHTVELEKNDDGTISITGYRNGHDIHCIASAHCNCAFWIDHNRVVPMMQR